MGEWTSSRQQGNRAFGKAGEAWVEGKLRALGFDVYVTSTNAECDLVLPNSTTVEVKTASRTERLVHGHPQKWFQFSFGRNGIDNDEDLFFLVCCDDSGEFLGAFIIPGEKLGTNRKTIKITRADPSEYAGQWSLYWNRWDLVHTVVESRAGHDRNYLEEAFADIPF